MRRFLLFLGLSIIVSSCGFNGDRQGETTNQDDVQPGVVLEEGKGLLKDLIGAIVKELGDPAEVDSAEEEQAEQEPDEIPAASGKWYDRDFSMTIQSYTYSMSGKHDASSDARHIVTRTGNTVRIRTEEASGTIVETVCEFTADGKRHVKQYMNGNLSRTHTDDKTKESYLLNWMTQDDHGPLNYHADTSYAQSETKLCGRPVKVIETEVDENLLGVKKHIEKKYYVDAQYDFLYKVVKSGGAAGMNVNNVALWEVTAFTDRPAKK